MRFAKVIIIPLLLLLGILVALLGSNAGNKVIIHALSKTQLPLELELDQGSVLKLARWKKILWRGDLFQFSVTDLHYDLDLNCLFIGELCADQIKATSVSFTMSLSDKVSDEVTEGLETTSAVTMADALARISELDKQVDNGNWQLNIPVLIRVGQVDLANVLVQVGNTLVKAERLIGSVDLEGRNIRVHRLFTDDVFVQVLTQQYKQKTDVEIGTPTEISTLTEKSRRKDGAQSNQVDELMDAYPLYQVSVPLRVDANAALLTNTKLQVNGLFFDFNEIDLVGFIDGGEVAIAKLDVVMPQAYSKFSGEILLQRDYPLNATLTSKVKQPLLLNTLVLDVKASGSIEKMKLQINSSRLFNSQIESTFAWLKPSIPFLIEAKWQDLTWPLIEPSYMRSAEGVLTLRGDLDNYSATIAGLLNIDNAPSLKIKGAGKGNLSELIIVEAEAQTLGGVIDGTGRINWQNNFTLNSELSTKGVFLERYWPEIRVKPRGNIAVDFANSDYNDWRVNIHAIDLQTDIEGIPLSLRGALQLDPSLYWEVNDLELERGQDSIRLGGVIKDEFTLDGVVAIKALQPYIDGSEGRVSGTFHITGKQAAPWLDFELVADDILFREAALKRAELIGKISLAARPDGSAVLTGADMVIAGEVINELELSYTTDLSNNISELATRTAKQSNSIIASPRSQISLKLTNDNNQGELSILGSWQEDTWFGQVANGYIHSQYGRWLIDKGVEFNFSTEDQQLYIERHCWNEIKAKVCLGFDGKLDAADSFEFLLQNYDVNRLRLVTLDNVEIEGLLNIESKLSWDANARMQLDSKINIVNGSLLIYSEEKNTIANFEQIKMGLRLDESSLVAKINVQSSELGGVTGDLRVDDIQGERELSGDVHILDIDLAFIEPLIYQFDVLNGVISGAGLLGGTLGKPELIGQFNLDNGYLAGSELPVTLKNFGLNIEARGQTASVTGTAVSGKGLAKVVGNIAWQNKITYNLLLRGDDFEFDDNKGLRLKFSPDITLKGDSFGAKITGNIAIPYARIKVKQLPQSAIQVSRDVVIIDAYSDVSRAAFPLDLQINISLLDNVKIDSFGLESYVTGDVSIALDKRGSISSDGILQFEKGRYRSFGQDLYIRKGQVVFSGPIDNPYLNIEAIRNPELTDDNVIVGVRLIGSVNKPVFTIFSEPLMPQTQMISYLLRGRDISSEDETSQDVLLTTMLVGSSLGQSKGIINTLGDTLGVEDFAIATMGQGDDTRVEVSGYVLPGVQIRYGIGLFSTLSEVAVRYEFLPKLYIELITGVDIAVDLYYKFSN
jgi:translocation and assembly module TamB